MSVLYVDTVNGNKHKIIFPPHVYNWIIERLVSLEKLGIRLTEESAERNARLDRIEESNRRVVELINEIDTQMFQELGLTIEQTSKMSK